MNYCILLVLNFEIPGFLVLCVAREACREGDGNCNPAGRNCIFSSLDIFSLREEFYIPSFGMYIPRFGMYVPSFGIYIPSLGI